MRGNDKVTFLKNTMNDGVKFLLYSRKKSIISDWKETKEEKNNISRLEEIVRNAFCVLYSGDDYLKGCCGQLCYKYRYDMNNKLQVIYVCIGCRVLGHIVMDGFDDLEMGFDE